MGHVPPPPPPFIRGAHYHKPEPPPKPIGPVRRALADLTPIEWVIALAIVGCIVFAVLQPINEARVFNRCTGSNITAWDALWADFRVLDCKPPAEKPR